MPPHFYIIVKNQSYIPWIFEYNKTCPRITKKIRIFVINEIIAHIFIEKLKNRIKNPKT